jgi:hypothetical protein
MLLALEVAAVATGIPADHLESWVAAGHLKAVHHNDAVYVNPERIPAAQKAARHAGYERLARKLRPADT